MPILDLNQDWKTPQAENYLVGNGVQGNMDTVKIMQEIAKNRCHVPSLRTQALQIVHHVKSHHYRDEARAIGEWVQKKVRYARDCAGVEQLHDPVMLLDQISRGHCAADCDDMSLLAATLLISIGCTPYFRVVRYNPASPSFNHIYVVCYEKNMRGPKERLVIDAIVKDKPIGFEVKHASGKEISVL
jgi:hypothetical protein